MRQVSKSVKERFWQRRYGHAKEYRHSGIDVSELRTIDRGRETRDTSNRDEKEGARRGASLHAN